jgi:hypothetical protein
MNDIRHWHRERPVGIPPLHVPDFGQAANDICEKALNDAKEHLHPLMRTVELRHLRKRNEFVEAFKSALAQRIAERLAVWQPGVLAVFQFDESWRDAFWDGSIHLLVKVPRLSDAIKTLGKKLDRSLTGCLKGLGWSRFRGRQSMLEVQQVTLNELRHGVSYGAMFHAFYNVPVEVWSTKRTHRN